MVLGVVAAVNAEDGTLAIDYDDGDHEDGVEAADDARRPTPTTTTA